MRVHESRGAFPILSNSALTTSNDDSPKTSATVRSGHLTIHGWLSQQLHCLVGGGFEVVGVGAVELSVGGHDDGLPDVFETDFSDASELLQLAVGVGDDGRLTLFFVAYSATASGLLPELTATNTTGLPR